MSKTICALPFIHLTVMPNGNAHPCCTSPVPLAGADGRPMNIRTHSFEEMWTSEALREIRRQMLAGQEPKHCANCYMTERAGFDSVRTNYNRMILGDPSPTDKFTGFSRIPVVSLKETMGKPTYFDLRFDNVCNLKCVICNAGSSSSIENDPVHMTWTKEKPIDREINRFTNSKKWVASERLQQELIEIGENVEYIRLAGGEPFRSAAALKWMDHLVEAGKAKDVTLQVYTNFQRFDQRLIDMLAAFKYVSLILSIDATGPTYEYVRYPGKWSIIERNVALLLENQKDKLSRVAVSINATMSILGAFRITDVFDWAGGHRIGVNLSNACDPEYVSLRYLPEASKTRLESLLRDFAKRWPGPHFSSQLDQWMTDMRSVKSTDTPDKVANVVGFIAAMDRSRGLNFRALDPQLMDEFDAQLGRRAAPPVLPNGSFWRDRLRPFARLVRTS
jgi:MoaA/NifB/PqqE/SkfB family radical SAM enzyme